MKILIDIGHPAHVHYFKNTVIHFEKKGWEILFTIRDKEVTKQLLDYYGFNYISFGKPFNSKFGKVIGIFIFTYKLYRVARQFKPDIFLNATQYSAFTSFLLNKPHFSLEDTFNMEQVRLYKPFTNAILTGDYDHPLQGRKEIRYSGYQELMYLHPNYFKPNIKTLDVLKLSISEKYVIIRFVAWNASHDTGQVGFSNDEKIQLVRELSMRIKVFISSEGPLPKELLEYKINLPPHLMHDILAFASLFIGEGATMASECAMLGVPAIYVNSLNVFTIREQNERFGLIFSYRSGIGVLQKAIELIDKDVTNEFKIRSLKMLSEKIDVTAFFIWFIEDYPQSFKIMKENPDYQLRFK